MPFKVKVKKDGSRDGKHAMSVTSDGYQWMTFSDLSPEQLLRIERAIHEYLGRLSKANSPTVAAQPGVQSDRAKIPAEKKWSSYVR